MTSGEIRAVSDAADAACPRWIEILHPNFRIPNGLGVRLSPGWLRRGIEQL